MVLGVQLCNWLWCYILPFPVPVLLYTAIYEDCVPHTTTLIANALNFLKHRLEASGMPSMSYTQRSNQSQRLLPARPALFHPSPPINTTTPSNSYPPTQNRNSHQEEQVHIHKSRPLLSISANTQHFSKHPAQPIVASSSRPLISCQSLFQDVPFDTLPIRLRPFFQWLHPL